MPYYSVNLWLGILYFFTRSCAHQQTTSSSYSWVGRTWEANASKRYNFCHVVGWEFLQWTLTYRWPLFSKLLKKWHCTTLHMSHLNSRESQSIFITYIQINDVKLGVNSANNIFGSIHATNILTSYSQWPIIFTEVFSNIIYRKNHRIKQTHQPHGSGKCFLQQRTNRNEWEQIRIKWLLRFEIAYVQLR